MSHRSNRPPPPLAVHSWALEAPDVRLAWITKPRVGESVSGDAVVVRRYGAGALVAVVDALGHGPNAARVQEAAVEWLGAAPDADTIDPLIQGLHKALAGLRGAATLLFGISARGIEACSVGNVSLRSVTGKLPFVLTPGVLGQRLRAPRTCFTAAPLTDRFVLFSDGISGRFDLKAEASQSPEELATHLFAKHRHAHDDSTAVVVDVKL